MKIKTISSESLRRACVKSHAQPIDEFKIVTTTIMPEILGAEKQFKVDVVRLAKWKAVPLFRTQTVNSKISRKTVPLHSITEENHTQPRVKLRNGTVHLNSKSVPEFVDSNKLNVAPRPLQKPSRDTIKRHKSKSQRAKVDNTKSKSCSDMAMNMESSGAKSNISVNQETENKVLTSESVGHKTTYPERAGKTQSKDALSDRREWREERRKRALVATDPN